MINSNIYYSKHIRPVIDNSYSRIKHKFDIFKICTII